MSDLHFEQAQFIKENESKGEENKAKLQAVARFIAGTTLLQVINPELCRGVFNLLSYYNRKDYSQILFDQTDDIIEEVENLKDDPQFNRLHDSMKKLAELNSQIRQEKQNEKQDDSSSL